ncbi:HesA/MoeB/ThiF family protein [Cognatiyoonia sp. IB215182]|uniref:HesA/MoeB/ThiF family protein n=1 Tax=Cognatiyoonia sp. IB215182 TaxID=3097353 RepID=UPI002A0FCF6C|nr:ThiF family adenylyltransferase [Cognatiyoonia sp. IB215182]MDX8355511.1 ThiF family adenylyltransferase [Cognatiyoonia sp. IB215182]
MTRYARQMILPGIGAAGQRRLGDAHVLVVGAGGLAAPLLPLLAGAGVGRIALIDGDRVSLSNLHRQTLFTEADCGQPKVQVAARRCIEINCDIVVEAIAQKLTPANAFALVAQADLVLDCADSYAVSYVLSDLCLDQNTPLISASVLGLGGYVGGFCGGAPSLRAVFPNAPDSGASCATAGVLGPVVGTIGAMQAQMALNVLLGFNPSPLGLLVNFNAQTLSMSGFRFDTAPEPATRFPFCAASQLTEDDLIIELRPQDEAPTPIHPAARRLTFPEIQSVRAPRVALCCATGLRAWRVAENLQPNWSGEIVLVAASAS